MPNKPNDIEFRPSTAEDSEYAYGLYKRTMKDIITEQVGGWPEDIMRDFFLGKFLNKDSRIIFSGGERIGCCQISEAGDHIWLGRTYLESSGRKRGIGGYLVQQALDLAHEKKKPLKAEVAKNNKAGLAFFQNRGFSVYGENEYELLIRQKDTVKYENAPSSKPPSSRRPSP